MCGICGFVEPEGVRPERALLERMNQRLFHRGPDGGGEWIQSRAAIAMRRLAIIDLSSGQQPMFNETGDIGIVFNGEIYNYHELRADLERHGHRFATQSDTESIVHLYEQYGVDGIARLNGMFAIAIWDSREQRLILARDRAGKKPLYYASLPDGVAFASELQSLLSYPGLSREIDVTAMDNYFTFGYVPAPLSIYRSIRQLPPGHLLTWQNARLETQRYWRLRPAKRTASSRAEAVDELYQLLEDAVRIRLYSDVPFGALLSGGVDSSLVVGLMSRQMGRKLKTFTVGFSESQFDESSHAAEVAKLFDTEHHNLRLGAPAVMEVLEKLVGHFGEPFADSSAIPTFLVSQLAREHVTMALSGDGGDEVFGGYKSYRYHHLIDRYRNVPASLRASVKLASKVFAGAAPGRLGRRVSRFVNEAELPVEIRWAHSRSIFTESEQKRLYSPEIEAQVQTERRGFRLRDSFDYFFQHSDDGGDVINFVDYETYLPDDILVKTDRTSMAVSLELRAPLLDYRIAEFAASLPKQWKWDSRGGKYILKDAAKKLLPDSILNRRKQGFVLPIAEWFRGELVPHVREKINSTGVGGILRLDYCNELLAAHQKYPNAGYDRKIWMILCFLIWHEQFLSQPA
jgi:asparagine synthase (glutamine-hydrolysing)